MRTVETLYYLEIFAGERLRASRGLPEDVTLVEQHDPCVVRKATLEIGKPYDWPSQHWDEAQWSQYLSRLDLRHWTALRGREILGLASLRFAENEIELDSFGLIPACLGQGLGGPFLVAVADLAWQEAPHAGRMWLHTSSADHPHALDNYLHRGFRLYRTIQPTE